LFGHDCRLTVIVARVIIIDMENMDGPKNNAEMEFSESSINLDNGGNVDLLLDIIDEDFIADFSMTHDFKKQVDLENAEGAGAITLFRTKEEIDQMLQQNQDNRGKFENSLKEVIGYNELAAENDDPGYQKELVATWKRFRDAFVRKYIGNEPWDGKKENRAVFRKLLEAKKSSILSQQMVAEIFQRHIRSEAEIFDALSDDMKSKIIAWKSDYNRIDKWIDGHEGGRPNEEKACAALGIDREYHRQLGEEISRLGLSQYVSNLPKE